MKLIVLLDSSKEKFKELCEIANEYDSFLIDTTVMPGVEINESGLIETMIEFRKELDENNRNKETDIMMVRFSGKVDVTKTLGDDCSEMIVPMSFKRDTHLYSLNPSDYRNQFESILHTFIS